VGKLGRGERIPNSSSVVDNTGGLGFVGGIESSVVLRIALIGKVGGSEAVNMMGVGVVEVSVWG
jgi:hypothetical protein